CREEPRLRALLDEARATAEEARKDKYFCANDVCARRLKPRLQRLVGWFRRGASNHALASNQADDHGAHNYSANNHCAHDHTAHAHALASNQAYDIAYQPIYDAPPACRRCGCMRVADVPGWRGSL